MQWGAIELLKNVYDTIKKEMKGPKIINQELEKNEIKILGKDISQKIEVNLKQLNSDPIIRDLKNEEKISILEAVLKKTISNILFLIDIIKVGNRKIIIEKTSLEINSLNFEKQRIDIRNSSIKLEAVEVKKIKDEFFTSIKNGNNYILKISKKIEGRSLNSFYKDEIQTIVNKIKMSLTITSLKSYDVLAVFKSLPVNNIKNINYFEERNYIDLYFSNNISGKKKSDFIILKNKISNKIIKIFI